MRHLLRLAALAIVGCAILASPAAAGSRIKDIVQFEGVRENMLVATLNAPDSFERAVGALPEGATIEEGGAGLADRVFLFCTSQAELARDFAGAVRRLKKDGGLWIAWPKLSSRVATDLTMTVIREFAIARGFVDYKVCAIDNTWSASAYGRRRV